MQIDDRIPFTEITVFPVASHCRMHRQPHERPHALWCWLPLIASKATVVAASVVSGAQAPRLACFSFHCSSVSTLCMSQLLQRNARH